jgi:cytochrome c oxidase subunit 3
MGLAAIVMLFAAFTSALVVRKGMSTDWVPTALPPIIYLNTFILLCSSLTMEISRRSLKAGSGVRFERWLYATVVLGVAFVACQLLAWRQLASRGVYLATNPSSSFFYLLTAAHGVHLLGGIAALFYLVFRARSLVTAPARPVSVDLTTIYWHFMDGLWIYLLLLLMVRL